MKNLIKMSFYYKYITFLPKIIFGLLGANIARGNQIDN